MGNYVCKTDYGGEELFFTGFEYIEKGKYHADIDKIEAAKSFKSYAVARKCCHELNEKCVNVKFTVKSL